MKISTKGRYALRMMIDIAEHSAQGTVSIMSLYNSVGRICPTTKKSTHDFARKCFF
jgi:DNA-binding IscR family transcriptional regulator